MEILFPHLIETLRIVFGYLWPNPYYQIPEQETAHALSRVSLATGVTEEGNSTQAPTLSPPESLHEVTGLPPILPELPELPGISNYNQQVEALQQGIEEHNRHLRELPLTVDQKVEHLLARIWSGINLDKVMFTEGHITYHHLWNIDQNANPHFYTKSSQAEDDNYKPPCLEDFDSQEEEEGKEEHHLPIPGP